MTVLTKQQQRLRRRRRVRAKIRGTGERPRLSVYRSNRGVFAQLVDDESGRTLAAVNWTEKELRSLGPTEQAKRAGEVLAERAKGAGIEACVFDRGGYRFHGRVKALAEAANEAGLKCCEHKPGKKIKAPKEAAPAKPEPKAKGKKEKAEKGEKASV